MKKFRPVKKLSSISFTKEGYENIKTEHKTLTEERKNAVKNLTRARELGDLSENGFYKAARARLSSIDSTLRRLYILIKRGKVVEKPQEGTIGINSEVVVDDGRNTLKFLIVGRYESDPSKGKISDESPIGKKLIGKKIGETISVQTPRGDVVYKILEVK